ncbi:MAG: hypothetical protein AB7I33_15220 [Gemmatimonadales bacterium]
MTTLIRRPCLNVLVVAFALTAASSALRAQQKPGAGPGPLGPQVPFKVSVTPDNITTTTRTTNTGGYQQSFLVRNLGTNADQYFIECQGHTNVTCTNVTPSSVSLASGAQTSVTATYSVGSVGTGRLVVQAVGEAEDTGYVNVPVAGVAGKPGVALRNHNGDNQDRSLCLTVGAGENASYSCGDLVVSHAMPAYSTMGRERALSLLYNSAAAFPRPTVMVAVTEPANVSRPDDIYLELKVNNVIRYSGTAGAWGGYAYDDTRQLSAWYSGAGDSTGLYPFTLLVRNIYGTTVKDTMVADTLIVVNRIGSEYGAGRISSGSGATVRRNGIGRSMRPTGPHRWAPSETRSPTAARRSATPARCGTA